MKIIIPLLAFLFFTLNSYAQSKPKYSIKVVCKDRHVFRGVFYAVSTNQLVLLKHNDTLKINFANVKDLYISKKGLVLPFMLVGAGIFFILAAEADLPLDQLGYLVGGVPLGVGVGSLVGQLFANKRFYKGLVETDFLTIRPDLERYTQVKNAMPNKVN
ncbi:MAG: hypothetical protein EOO47_18785 [Flavobacterium sp.]|nr:MAG: hypothetical protein EOO47_18785 [Flavobacterium sp.]